MKHMLDYFSCAVASVLCGKDAYSAPWLEDIRCFDVLDCRGDGESGEEEGDGQGGIDEHDNMDDGEDGGWL